MEGIAEEHAKQYAAASIHKYVVYMDVSMLMYIHIIVGSMGTKRTSQMSPEHLQKAGGR